MDKFDPKKMLKIRQTKNYFLSLGCTNLPKERLYVIEPPEHRKF